jgi:hypothetical protein
MTTVKTSIRKVLRLRGKDWWRRIIPIFRLEYLELTVEEIDVRLQSIVDNDRLGSKIENAWISFSFIWVINSTPCNILQSRQD